ncbi:MAG: hypothetical protein CSB47_04840 [Proteobacteria bacterium]|nr:MAG: hypothetical protein CSB47_04840 [Pseudomonadota bacterium]
MLFKNSSIYVLAKIVPGLMAFAALSVYTHLLTPQEYGVYTLIFSAALFFHSAFLNWLPVGTMRFWPGGIYSERAFITTLGVIYLRLAVPITVIAALIILLLGKDYVLPVLVGLLLLVGFAALMIGQQLQSAQMLPNRYAMLTVSYSVLSLSLGAACAYFGFGPIGVVVGVACGMLIPSVIISAKSWVLFDRTYYTPELTQKLLIYGTPLAASFFMDEIANLSDRYMLAWMVDKAEAGKYAVGYDLAGNSIMMVMNAINLAAYPMIVKLLDQKGQEAALEYFNTYVILLLGISIPAVVGLSLVGPDLVYLMIGEKYQESVVLVLPWIASALFFMGLGAFYFHLPFQLGNKNLGIFKIAIFVAIINLLLNVLLIPRMGMHGAAISTLLSFMIASVLGYFYGRKVFPIPLPMTDIAKIIIATLGMGVCLWFVKDLRGWHWLVLQMTIGLGSYGLVAYLLNIGGIKQVIAARYA